MSVQQELKNCHQEYHASSADGPEGLPGNEGQYLQGTNYREWMDYLGSITSLEQLYTNVVNRMNARAVQLSETASKFIRIGGKEKVKAEMEGSKAVQCAWNWLANIHKCAEKHLDSAAQYHSVY